VHIGRVSGNSFILRLLVEVAVYIDFRRPSSSRAPSLWAAVYKMIMMNTYTYGLAEDDSGSTGFGSNHSVSRNA